MDLALDTYRYALIDFLKRQYGLKGGSIQSAIPCLSFNMETSLSEFKSIMYEPCLCIILQGAKAVGFGNEMYRYDPSLYLLASTHIPSDIKILEASEALPYLSLTIKFTLEDIYEVLKNTHPEKLKCEHKSEKGLFFDALHVRLYEPILRLVKLLDKPKEDIDFLSPLIIKEILYTLVNDKSGYLLNKFAMEGTTSNKIVKAITDGRDRFYMAMAHFAFFACQKT